MISRLKGKVSFFGPGRLEIEIQGVGWEIFLAERVLGQIKLGEVREIFTFHHVTEKIEALYGFLQREDEIIFEKLLSVAGIGPKTALLIFNAGSGERIWRAIAEADVDFFQQIKGLGRKKSQRVIVELKSQVDALKELNLKTGAGGREPVYRALENLGFRREEIREALNEIPEALKSEPEIIRYALRKLGKNEN